MYDEFVTTAKTGATLAATGGSVATGVAMFGVPLWAWAVGAILVGGGAYFVGSKTATNESE